MIAFIAFGVIGICIFTAIWLAAIAVRFAEDNSCDDE